MERIILSYFFAVFEKSGSPHFSQVNRKVFLPGSSPIYFSDSFTIRPSVSVFVPKINIDRMLVDKNLKKVNPS